MWIAIDFDGTLCDHRYPDIGQENPYAFMYLKEFKEAGCKLILYTMRSGVELEQAIKWCELRGIVFDGINTNPTQKTWTTSPKAYASCYIDDNAVGVPLRENPSRVGSRPMVNWSLVGPMVLAKIQKNQSIRN